MLSRQVGALCRRSCSRLDPTPLSGYKTLTAKATQTNIIESYSSAPSTRDKGSLHSTTFPELLYQCLPNDMSYPPYISAKPRSISQRLTVPLDLNSLIM